MRFCIIGTVAFVIDAGCARIFINFIPKVIALGLSYLLSCCFHYTFSKRWTFEDRTNHSLGKIWAYAWVNLVTLLTNVTLASFFMNLFEQNVILAKALALPPTSLLGFLLLRLFVFRSQAERDNLMVN